MTDLDMQISELGPEARERALVVSIAAQTLSSARRPGSGLVPVAAKVELGEIMVLADFILTGRSPGDSRAAVVATLEARKMNTMPQTRAEGEAYMADLRAKLTGPPVDDAPRPPEEFDTHDDITAPPKQGGPKYGGVAFPKDGKR